MRHTITVVKTGEQFHCGPEQHLLQGMQSFRIGKPLLKAIPVGCRGGGCGVCRVKVLGGQFEAKKMSCKHVTEQDRAAGVALACRVFPQSSMEIEVLPVEPSKNLADSQPQLKQTKAIGG